MDFGFARYDLNEITRRIELPEVSPDPAKPLTLIVRAAAAGNRDFANSLFKYVKAKTPDKTPGDAVQPPVDAPPAPPAAAPDEATVRREFAEIYAGTSIIGWENAFDGGKPAPFSIPAAQELLVQLMEHVPDVWRRRVRDYVDDVANFRPPTVDPVDLGKG